MSEGFDLTGLTHIGDRDPAVIGDEVIGTCACGARWQGEAACHCPTCHLTFGSVSGFDEHRWRPNRGRLPQSGPTGIICRTADQMRARGYEPNDNGYWRRPRPEDTLPA